MHRFIRRNPPPRERKYYKKTAGRRTLPVRRDFARPIQRYVVRVLEDDTDYPEYPYFLRIAPYKDGYDAVLEILANATIFDTKHAAHSALQYYKSMIDAAELAHMTFQIVVFRPDLRKEDVLDNPPMRSKYKSYKRLQPVQSYVVRIYHDLVEEPVYLTKYYENFINERGERAWYFAPTRYFTQVVVFNTKEEAKRAFFRYRGRLSSSLRDGVSFVVEVFRPDVTGSKNIVNNPHGLEFPQIGEPSAWAIAIFDRGGLLPISYVRSTKYETPEITESQHNALSYVTKEAATGVMDVRAFGIRLAYKKYWSEVSGITVPASDVVLEAVPYAGHDK